MCSLCLYFVLVLLHGRRATQRQNGFFVCSWEMIGKHSRAKVWKTKESEWIGNFINIIVREP